MPNMLSESLPDKPSFGNTLNALERAIAIAQRRHSVIASNISNVDTPGYRTKEIDFKQVLKRAISTTGNIDLTLTNRSHMPLGEPLGQDLNTGLETDEDNGVWNGINWVDLDREIMKLSENNLIYRSSVEALLRKIDTLKEVIKEGGR